MSELQYALDRMSTPLDASRLSGATADEDARCMGIIRAALDRLTRELAEAREWNRQMVEKAASGGTLDGYRELGAKVAAAENERDALRAAAKRARAALGLVLAKEQPE